ncbi:MAG: ABC transporter permease subunit [Eubacteriales bacterium]|nr:ABC transporter permease subunit [Eubacteriales bacterium]
MTEPLKPTVRKRTFSERFVREIRKNWGLYLLVSIPLLYLILFKYWPMYGVQIAFRNYSPARSIANSPWVGLKYFQKFMGNYQFKRILDNTIAISLYSLLTFPLPILLAVLLNYVTRPRFKKTVQMISYMPHFISTVVMVGIILQFLDVRSGMLNMLLTALGREPVNFMAKPAYFRTIYILSGVWQSLGYNSIIYIAALSGVSPELHEAAIVDGANILKRIWHVDLPGILPTISILLIMQCGSILSVGYEKIYLMQNSLNLSVSEIISTYVYKQGIAASMPQYSYATAIGLFVSVVNVIMLLIVNAASNRLSGNSLF